MRPPVILAALLLFSVLPGRGNAAALCRNEGNIHLWISPRVPTSNRPLRVLVTSRGAAPGNRITVVSIRNGTITTVQGVPQEGLPHALDVPIEPLAIGRYRILMGDPDSPLACAEITVQGKRAADENRKEQTYWPTLKDWDADHEDLYSAWVERLFEAPVDEELGFRPLAEALRDRKRNALFDHLGLGEDAPNNRRALKAAPDCADLPYFLRAYFAWKMGLPFGMRQCDRGTQSRAPRCDGLATNTDPIKATSALDAFAQFSRLLANTAHSGSIRTALADENTDFYPIDLDREALRPGAVFADPYGHVLVAARWVPQKDGRPGLLLAIDGQPDASITRKRFWEGNFLYANNLESAGAGWKWYRPLIRSTNAPGAPLPHFSMAQSKMDADAFYARMGKLINPAGMDAMTAYDETLNALHEQLQARVRSVDNGEQYMKTNHDPVVEMPEGPRIFETIGPWEDYATPSRDLRLLIAMAVLENLPHRVVQHPELFQLKGQAPADVAQAIEARHRAQIVGRFIDYTRSDGSSFRLSVADILARKEALQMAYNPNACVELRWGAKPGSAEATACRRQIPEGQLKKMAEYRKWFAEARRPPRP
jgi:hypothetical protein